MQITCQAGAGRDQRDYFNANEEDGISCGNYRPILKKLKSAFFAVDGNKQPIDFHGKLGLGFNERWKRMKINQLILGCALILSGAAFYSALSQADSPPIIINNNANNTPAPAASGTAPANNNGNGCNTSSNNNNTLRPGTYYQTDPRGGMDTVYTTGDKSMYNADVNCNNNNVPIQPYVYAPAPMPPSPPLRTR